MIQTVPSNLPKLPSNFSIDWLVKGDKSPSISDRKFTSPSPSLPPSPSSLPASPVSSVSPPMPIDQNSNHIHPIKLPGHGLPNAIMNHTLPPNHPHHPLNRSPYAQQLPLVQPANPLVMMQHQQQQQQLYNSQLQMAAALNYPYNAAAAAAAAMQPQAMNFSQIFSNNFHRTSYHMHRFPYGYGSADFLLHPYRKPKRIRTAFAPLQLLELENAFEGNQYVVGSERKALAKTLNLTETQVKVWFQNRRTKHKRMQQEGGPKNNRSLSDDDDETHTYLEDEEIDIEDTSSTAGEH